MTQKSMCGGGQGDRPSPRRRIYPKPGEPGHIGAFTERTPQNAIISPDPQPFLLVWGVSFP